MNDANISSAVERNTAASAPSEATENNVQMVDQVDQDGNHQGWLRRYVRKSKLRPIEGNMRTLWYRQYFRLEEARGRSKSLTKIQQASLERFSIGVVDVSTKLSNAE